ncbi:bifunctional isocitrate dehydrogenase kinase/phosphatase [Saccharospirillum salsuginis]|nr:bifunctional isocitrate dehydrogenase kinase/phosphatase [Saccharospirillum salsuginis]
MSMTDDQAAQLADLILAGFDRHYRKFRHYSHLARDGFLKAEWRYLQDIHRERVDLYDDQVDHCIATLKDRFEHLSPEGWQSVKQAYSKRLERHRQPDLAETFYNSVFCRLFHRRYFNNEHIFVESDALWRHYETDETLIRRYWVDGNLEAVFLNMLEDMELGLPLENPHRDVRHLMHRFAQEAPNLARAANRYSIDLITAPFFRNKACYLIGRLNIDGEALPFIVPILNNEDGHLYADTLLVDSNAMAIVFGFARAYFFVDTGSPLAIVNFLLRLMPSKTRAELYSSIGLHKQGKTQFYRELLQHLDTSRDRFEVAPGIKGMVMTVFTLPSYPYVFKIIKDRFAPQKEMTRQHVKNQYHRVKQNDRVGRMADTWEFSKVALPLNRFSDALLEELSKVAASNVRQEGEQLIIEHCYIERRMIPLNLYLEDPAYAGREEAVLKEYGQAIKDLAKANIFPGDMLLKNFGVTRHGRVIFYDYDEIDWVTNCNFRRIPPPRYPEDELASEPWYSVAPNDIFPEEFATFLFNDNRLEAAFRKHHGDLLDADYWTAVQAELNAGKVADIYPYPDHIRVKRA